MNKLLVNSEEEINNLVIEEDTEVVFNFNDTSRDIYSSRG